MSEKNKQKDEKKHRETGVIFIKMQGWYSIFIDKSILIIYNSRIHVRGIQSWKNIMLNFG